MKNHQLFFTIALSLMCTFVHAQQYDIRDDWITLNDGTRLSVSYYLPQTGSAHAKFPVLLEMLPYRKDDLSKAWAHPLYDYFASQGIALAKVDIRGTGSSSGQTPSREYSSQEIGDAVEIISALSAMPWSNGNVGMWGISWGGFNAIQVALRKPPALKAILAAHASDDLFKNDVHFNDGIFGIDEYILSINHMTGFMQSPDYAVNDAYFINRFDREPWLFETLRNSVNNEFWTRGSLNRQYQELDIPVYLIGGLLDGYRDTLPKVLENADVPVRAVLGPWPHAWPNSAAPGPTWEWREDAANWWKYWLQPSAVKKTEFEENSFRFFQRRGSEAESSASPLLEGDWFASPWPLPKRHKETLTLYPSIGKSLTAKAKQPTEVPLRRIASSGIDLGEWWGELLGDMAETDNESLVFDSPPLDDSVTLLGLPIVKILAASDANDGHWIIRLEDVSPEGEVSLVTGGAINGQMRESSTEPEAMEPAKFYSMTASLRMTTWTFQPGHKIRLAISNAAFPMYWPSANLVSSTLKIDTSETALELPLVLTEHLQSVSMPAGNSSNYLPADLIALGAIENFPSKREVIKNEELGTVDLIRESGVRYELPHATLEATRHTLHQANQLNPELTHYEGWAEYSLEKNLGMKDKLRYRTEIDLRSDNTHFHLAVSRFLFQGERELRNKNWNMKIPRGAH